MRWTEKINKCAKKELHNIFLEDMQLRTMKIIYCIIN